MYIRSVGLVVCSYFWERCLSHRLALKAASRFQRQGVCMHVNLDTMSGRTIYVIFACLTASVIAMPVDPGELIIS